jgi:hypothetical protein
MNDVLVSRRHIVSPKFGRLGERRFPESRRKAYYLMSIHEHLPPEAKRELKAVGWTKSLELAKLARRDPEHFDCATWLHKAREMPKEQFKQEVEKELNAGETEPWEIYLLQALPEPGGKQLESLENCSPVGGQFSERPLEPSQPMIYCDFSDLPNHMPNGFVPGSTRRIASASAAIS